MKTGADDKRKKLIAGVLGGIALVLVGYQLYSNLGGGSPATAPPPPVILTSPAAARSGAAAVKVGTTSGQLDPTLRMGAMLVTESLAYNGSGRNIFAPGSPEPIAAIPKPIAPVRPEPVKPAPVVAVVPQKPALPPINLKFFGTATSADGTRRAFILNGDDVFVAAAGDVVQRRYKIVSVDAKSIMVEDLPNSNRQTLPLLGP